MTPTTPGERRALVGIVSAAFLLRAWASSDQFWLDEIFTYYLAMQLDSPLDAIFRIQIEHHTLNTLFMSLIGDQDNWFWYRLLSVVTGTASVALLAHIGFHRGVAEGLIAAALAAVSFPLVQYSSEARGYAPAIFFVLLAFVFIQKPWRSRSSGSPVLFWLSTWLALLAHPSSLYIYLAIAVWSLRRSWESNAGRPSRTAVEMMTYHAPIVIPFGALYWFAIRGAAPIGGNILSLSDVLRDTLCLLVGSPVIGWWQWIGALGACGLLIGGFTALRKDEDISVFYFCALLLMPAIVLLLANRKHVYLRYFVVCYPFFYLLVADLLARLYRGTQSSRLASITLLALLSMGNVSASLPLLLHGRGHYLEALLYMRNRSSQDEIAIGSDHDFRNRLTLEFYRRYVEGNERIVYVTFDHWPRSGPEWIITHHGDPARQPKPSLVVKKASYTLTKSFLSGGLSGFSWHIYHNDGFPMQGEIP